MNSRRFLATAVLVGLGLGCISVYAEIKNDHRIIDGREAVLSLVAIKEALEDPARLLLDL